MADQVDGSSGTPLILNEDDEPNGENNDGLPLFYEETHSDEDEEKIIYSDEEESLDEETHSEEEEEESKYSLTKLFSELYYQ
jgi:hypothetical protein